MSLMGLLWVLLVWIASAVPLYFAVKLMGSKASFLTVLIANVVVAVAAYFIQQYVGFFAGFLSFFVMLFVYKMIFELGWIRSFFAWLLQFVIIGLLVFLLIVLGVIALV